MAGNTNALSVSNILIARRSHFTSWKLAVGAFKAYGHQWQGPDWPCHVGHWALYSDMVGWMGSYSCDFVISETLGTDLDRSLELHDTHPFY